MSPTVIRGFSDVYGSCSTIWMLRRARRRPWPDRRAMFSPRTITSPLVGFSRPTSSLARVDLPQPDSPTMPSVSPRRSWMSTPSTAWTAPVLVLKTMPWVIGKCLTRLRVSSTRSDTSDTEDLPDEVASGLPVRRDPVRGRLLLPADLPGVAAARVERAPARNVGEHRRQAADDVELPALAVQARDRSEQGLGVRVGRALVDVVDRRLLDHLAGVHDRDPVGDVGDHAHVVRDQDQAHVALVLEFGEQAHDLRLDG